jgi:hypothetical protein
VLRCAVEWRKGEKEKVGCCAVECRKGREEPMHVCVVRWVAPGAWRGGGSPCEVGGAWHGEAAWRGTGWCQPVGILCTVAHHIYVPHCYLTY